MLKQFAVICVFTIAIASMCRSQSIDPAALQEASIKMPAAIDAGHEFVYRIMEDQSIPAFGNEDATFSFLRFDRRMDLQLESRS